MWKWPLGKRTVNIIKGKLEDVDVSRVSLLFDGWKPKNGKGVIYKGSKKKVKHVVKGNEGYVYLTVMEPNVKDSDGDSYTAEEIQKACDKFAKKGMTGKINVNHSDEMLDDFYITQSYILKGKDKENFPDTAVDSWVWIAKCEDLENPYWQKIVKGLCNGASLEAKAVDAGDGPDLSAAIKGLEDNIAKLTKIVKGETDGKDAKAILAEAEATLAKLKEQNVDSEAEETLKGLGKALTKATKELSKAISHTIKGSGGGADEVEDREVVINGEKFVVKGSHEELYKGIASVDAGSKMNILDENTTSLFVDSVVDSKPGDTLTDISVVPLLKDEKIDKGLVDDIVFKNSADGALTASAVGTFEITCATNILLAELTLGRDTVEFYKDKYGEAAFGAYVEHKLAKKAEKALRKLLFKGDRTSSTAALKALDGVLTQATSNTDIDNINSVTYGTWVDRFEQVLLGFSEDMLEEQEDFKIYVSQHDLIRIRSEISARETATGDRLLLEGGKISFAGIPVKARFVPDNTIIAGLMKFIFCGVRTDAEMKVEHHGSDWKYHWYIRLRAGFTYLPNFVKFHKLVTS
jgi:vacuolar-type H+-ATPase subunit E/Vma4